MTKPRQFKHIMSEKEAAEYIGMSTSYLQKDRMNGILPNRVPGPRYAKVGRRIMYLRDDLDAWLHSHLIERSSPFEDN